jgi:hypothetical protein
MLDEAHALRKRKIALDDADRGVKAGMHFGFCAALLEERGALLPFKAEEIDERQFRGYGLLIAVLIIRTACFVQQHRHCQLQLPALVAGQCSSVFLRVGERALECSEHDDR